MSAKKLERFRTRAGGITAAALLIQAALKCSYSKAEKIAAGRYPNRVSAAEQEKIDELIESAPTASTQQAV